jgi:hypothetical protein
LSTTSEHAPYNPSNFVAKESEKTSQIKAVTLAEGAALGGKEHYWTYVKGKPALVS